MSTTNTPTQVTLDRIIATAENLGIDLEEAITGRSAQANVNGVPLFFVLLETVLVIRSDFATDEPTQSAQANYFLAANQANAPYVLARQVAVTHFDTLVVRSEHELSVAGGLTDAQLEHAFRRGVDAVTTGHQIMLAHFEELNEMEAAARGEAPQAPPHQTSDE